MWSSLCLGFLVIRSSSPGSQASPIAGMRSVPMEMYSTTTVVSGQGICKTTKAMKGSIWPTCEVRAQQMDFLMLSQIFLPYSIPNTIELKSSLSRIMSAASFATSVPVMPIETPISAFLMAGESFTPSPVTATTSPARWHPFTITNFWAGVVLAKTIWLLVSHFSSFFPCSDSGRPSSSSAIWVNMSPWMTTAFDSAKHSSKVLPVLSAIQLTVSSVMMLHCLAMEAAVTGWSPVTITTFTPADRHFRTAQGTASLGGSERDSTPTKHSPFRSSGLSMSKLQFLGNLLLGRWHLAKPSTLQPFLPNVALACSKRFSHSSVLGMASPPRSMKVDLAQMRSGAPFMKTQKCESSLQQQLIEKAYFRAELKGMRHSLPQLSRTTGQRSLIALISSMGWKNLIRPDSEASPVVGISRYFMFFKLSFHSRSISLIISSFCSGLMAVSLRTALTLSAGSDRSKLATEQTTAASWMALKPGSLGSYWQRQSGPRFCWFSALHSLPLYQILEAVILFMVNVPVLSEQMQLVAPKVSTASRNFTKTFLLDKIQAVRVSPTVISTISPSGTLAVMTPIANTKLSTAGQPIAKPNPKRIAPIKIEKIVSRRMKRLIYFWRGVYSSSSAAVAARLAMRPMNVLSPVLKTTPLPVPSLFNVEKNATFLLSKGLSWVLLVLRAKSSVSPVSEELSTFIPCESIILRSAGIFFPSSTFTTSPTTSLVASNLVSIPFLMTMVSGGMKSLKESMMDWLFMVWQKLMEPVIRMMAMMMVARQRLESPPPRPYATKIRAAPAQSIKEKGVTSSFNSSRAQCVPFFSDSLFGPSFSNLDSASSLVSPVFTLVEQRVQNSSMGILWSSESWNLLASWTA